MTSGGNLADLLDRLLDRGVYLRADVIITVAGVPLLGLSLTALLGSVDTMLAYGVFDGTDPLLASRPHEPGSAKVGSAAGGASGLGGIGQRKPLGNPHFGQHPHER